MMGRLDEIETNLHTRRARAEAEGWLGELEGIDLTLTFLDDKRADAECLHQLPPTRLWPTSPGGDAMTAGAGEQQDLPYGPPETVHRTALRHAACWMPATTPPKDLVIHRHFEGTHQPSTSPPAC